MIIKNNIVKYGNDVQLTDKGAISSRFIDPNTTTDNATFVDQKMPGDFKGGHLFYNDGAFTMTGSGLKYKIEQKKNAIRKNFEKSYISYTVNAGTDSEVVYHGDFDALIKIDCAVRMATAAGLTEVTLFDYYNNAHTMTTDEATALIVEIGANYEALFAIKQTKLTTLDSIDVTGVDAEDSTGAIAAYNAITTAVEIVSETTA